MMTPSSKADWQGGVGMTDSIELLRRAWSAYDRGDIEGFAACLTEDWREYDGAGEMATLNDERRTMAAQLVACPDKQTDIDRIIADGDLVACHCTTRATHTGQYFDLEPTGKTVVLYEMMFNRVVDEKLAETWAVTEGPGFYEQLTGRKAPEKGLDNMG
jgi:predicted ester cyclase